MQATVEPSGSPGGTEENLFFLASHLKKKDASSPDALILVNEDQWQRCQMLAGEARQKLQALRDEPNRRSPYWKREDREPGEMDALLSQLDSHEPLSAEAVCALRSAPAMQGDDPRTSPRLVEAAMVAQGQTHFLFSADEEVRRNAQDKTIDGHVSYALKRDMQRDEADFCLDAKHIAPDDSVAVFGGGLGHFGMRLQDRGVAEVVSFDPVTKDRARFLEYVKASEAASGRALSTAELARFEEVLPLTGEEFVASHPGKQFSVVIASNFHPVDSRDASSSREMFENALMDMWQMTRPGGKVLIGVSSTNPEWVFDAVEGQMGWSMFGPPKFHQASHDPNFKNYRQVAGQIGYLEFTKPRLKESVVDGLLLALSYAPVFDEALAEMPVATRLDFDLVFNTIGYRHEDRPFPDLKRLAATLFSLPPDEWKHAAALHADYLKRSFDPSLEDFSNRLADAYELSPVETQWIADAATQLEAPAATEGMKASWRVHAKQRRVE